MGGMVKDVTNITKGRGILRCGGLRGHYRVVVSGIREDIQERHIKHIKTHT
jgi:hypothetical protein